MLCFLLEIGQRICYKLRGSMFSDSLTALFFFFNHIWTKTLSSGDANVFAFKRGSNRLICPVRGLEMYFNISSFSGIQIAPGFVFRPVTRSDSVSLRSLESTAA